MNLLRLDPLRAPLVHRRWLGLLSLLAPGLAAANPLGGQVVAGQVSIGTPDPLTTVINQGSQTAVINWQQFNVGSQELVQFIQPSASAAILNRIVGGDASEILGSLRANGRVFLINPQGLMFGAGSKIDVGGLMASTLDIKDSDFLAGRYVFAGNGSTGSVVNHGRLSAADGGFIVLAGDSSRNTGLIQARLGDVVLASGSAMTLDLNGDGLLSYQVDGAALTSAAGVSNSGELLADGGRVLMTADVARGLVANAVNNSGVVRATSLVEQDGEILLLGEGGHVVNSGTLNASSATGEGGDIRVLGDRDVLITGGLIDASGATGGGSVRIGGGREGGEGLLQADRTYIARDAVVRVDATRQGDGGEIIAYSRNNSVLSGLLSARGGSQGGAGGFVETSSQGLLTVTRVPQVFASLIGSPGGHWLIDPHNITIVAGNGYGGIDSGNPSNPFESTSDGATLGVELIEEALQGGGNVTVATGDNGGSTEAGDITLAAALDFDGALTGTLTLDAHNDILINAAIADSFGGDDNLNLNLDAGRDIVLGGKITLGSSATANLTAGGHIRNALNGDQTLNKLSADTVNLVAGTGIGFGALTATNRVLVSASQISAVVDGDGDMVLNSLSGQDVVFTELSINGSGLLNANHRNGGLATFRDVFVENGSAQIGNIDGAAVVENASAGGVGENNGTVLAFAGNGTPIGERDLTIGTINASESVELSADGAILDGNFTSLNVIAPILNIGFTTGSVDLDTDIDSFSTVSAFAPPGNTLGIGGGLVLRERSDLRLDQVNAAYVQVFAYDGQIRQNLGQSIVADDGHIFMESQSADLKGTLDGSSGIYLYTYGGGILGNGLYRSDGSIGLYAYGDDLEASKVLAGGTISLVAGGDVQITGDDSSGDGVVVGYDSVYISGNSIRSSGNLFAYGRDDVAMQLYAGAGSVEVAGAIGVYSDYGGASLDVNAYFAYDEDPDGNVVIREGSGQIDTGSINVRAATYGGNSYDLYGSVPFAPPAAFASLDADGDIQTGNLRVESYHTLTYNLLGDYGGDALSFSGGEGEGQLQAASAELLINQGFHSSAGTVTVGRSAEEGIEVYGYGNSTLAVAGSGSVTVTGDVTVQSYSASLGRSYLGIGADGTEQVLTETRRLGTATVDIGDFGQFSSYGGFYVEPSPDFAVELGSLSVRGPNAQARVHAGTLHIGSDELGRSVHLQAYVSETDSSDQEFLSDSLHEVRDESDNLLYSSNVAIAQAEFLTSARGLTDQQSGTTLDSQQFDGSLSITGREASSHLLAANGGSVGVNDSITIRAAGYTIDGNFFDYGHNQLLGGYNERNYNQSLFGYSLPPLDAPPVGAFGDDAPIPYLHWGAGRLLIDGGSFDVESGEHLPGLAATVSLGGGIEVSGVGVATAAIQANQVSVGQAVDVEARQGAVLGQLGQALYFGDFVSLQPETVVTGYDPETETSSGYTVIRTVSGDPDNPIETTTGRAPVNAATAAYAGVSIGGGDSLSLQGPLTVTGLAAEAELLAGTITVDGAITIDGRPEGSRPSYYREDVVYLPFGDDPPAVPSESTTRLIGGRSGLLINGGVVRLNSGLDIRGTTLAAAVIEGSDVAITGDIRIDATTGLIESNDPALVGYEEDGTTVAAVSRELGIAALRISDLEGDEVFLNAGYGGYGGLSLTGTTDAQFDADRLTADGNVVLHASDPNGRVMDSIGDIVLAFEHPLDYEGQEASGGSRGQPVALDLSEEPTLGELLDSSSSVCFTGDDCTLRLTTGGDVDLIGSTILLQSLDLEADGNVYAGGAFVPSQDGVFLLGAGPAADVTLGNIEAGGNVRIGRFVEGFTGPSGFTTNNVSVGDITAAGRVDVRGLGNIVTGSLTSNGEGVLLRGAGPITVNGDLSAASFVDVLSLIENQYEVNPETQGPVIDPQTGEPVTAQQTVGNVLEQLTVNGSITSGGIVQLGNTDALDAHYIQSIQVSGPILAGGQVRGLASGAVNLGSVSADGGIDLGGSTLSVGNLGAGGAVTINSLGDLDLANRVSGSSVAISTAGILSGAGEGNLEIVASDGDLTLDIGQLSLPAGLLTLDAEDSLSLTVSTLDLNGFDFDAGGNVTITASDIGLTGGDIDGAVVTLTADGTGSQDQLRLTTVDIDAPSVQLTGPSVSLIEVDAFTQPLTSGTSATGNSIVVDGRRGITVSDSGLSTIQGGRIDLTSGSGAVSVLGGSTLTASTLKLTAAGSVTVQDSTLQVENLSTAGKAITELPAGLIQIDGLGITLRNSDLRGGDVTLLGGEALVTLDNGLIEGNIVRIEADAVTVPEAVTLRANGFGAQGRVLDFQFADFEFGTGAAPFGSDGGLFAELPESALDLIPESRTPNASFIATEVLTLGEISGTAQYLLLETPDVRFHGAIRGDEQLFMQFVPGADDQQVPINTLSFTQFVRTFAVGSSGFGGDIVIGGQSVGGGSSANYIFLTEGRVSGASSIPTNGRVVVLDSTPPPQPEPELPPDIENAEASQLVLVSDEFMPEDSREGSGDPDVGEQGQPGHGTVSSDDSEGTKQQCDAV